jgi:hypothetical protein
MVVAFLAASAGYLVVALGALAPKARVCFGTWGATLKTIGIQRTCPGASGSACVLHANVRGLAHLLVAVGTRHAAFGLRVACAVLRTARSAVVVASTGDGRLAIGIGRACLP